jgi:hypothetical protein
MTSQNTAARNGRGRSPAAQTRPHKVSTLLSDSEKALVLKACGKEPVSSWARDILLDAAAKAMAAPRARSAKRRAA